MKSFSELLSEYVNRIGVADAELARRLGVSRQTVFRWRQGLTQRPRHRQDVLTLAGKLRLDPAERDQLLMAAGFRPETISPDAEAPTARRAPSGDVPGQSANAGGTLGRVGDSDRSVSHRRFPTAWLLAALVVLALLLTGLISTGAWQTLVTGFDQTVRSGPGSEPRPATADETLILVSPFANYASEQVGFNVAGRLQEALREVFSDSGLEDVRVDVLPDTISDASAAQQTALRLSADLVIWGEYDSGRVVAYVSAPSGEGSVASQERRWMINTGGGLSTTINTDLPQDMQWMALYTLGRVHFMAGRGTQAEAVFQQALKLAPQDPNARGAIFDYLGLLESQKATPDQDKVIAYFTETIELLPELASVPNNRGVAYTERDQPGDIDRAIGDFRQAIRLDPDFAAAHLNLAIALLRQDPDAVDEAIALLERAEELDPNSASIQNALCWDMSLAGNPGEALPHCDQAILIDPSGYSNDSRGVALAMLGRPSEAIAEFHTFLDALQMGNPSAYEQYSSARSAWIASLEKGLDPFDTATRRALLQE